MTGSFGACKKRDAGIEIVYIETSKGDLIIIDREVLRII